MKKVIVIGLLAGLIMFVVSTVFSFVFNLGFPSVKQEYTNTQIFRPWSDPLMSLMFVHPFIVGIILAWLWTKLRAVLEPAGRKAWLYFSFGYLLFTIPGMVISYGTFPISLLMILSWTLSNFIQAVVATLVFSKFLKFRSNIQ